jgi:hypothetical protein
MRGRVNYSFSRIGFLRGHHNSKDSFCQPRSALLLWYNLTVSYEDMPPWPK